MLFIAYLAALTLSPNGHASAMPVTPTTLAAVEDAPYEPWKLDQTYRAKLAEIRTASRDPRRGAADARIEIVAPKDGEGAMFGSSLRTVLGEAGWNVVVDAREASSSASTAGKARAEIVVTLTSDPNAGWQLSGFDRRAASSLFVVGVKIPPSGLKLQAQQIEATAVWKRAIDQWLPNLLAGTTWIYELKLSDIPIQIDVDAIAGVLGSNTLGIQVDPNYSSSMGESDAGTSRAALLLLTYPKQLAVLKLKSELTRCVEGMKDNRLTLVWKEADLYSGEASLAPFEPPPAWWAKTEAGRRDPFDDARRGSLKRLDTNRNIVVLHAPEISDRTRTIITNQLQDGGFTFNSAAMLAIRGDAPGASDAALIRACEEQASTSHALILIRGTDSNPTAELVDPETAEIIAFATFPPSRNYGKYNPTSVDIGAARFLAGEMLDRYDSRFVNEKDPRGRIAVRITNAPSRERARSIEKAIEAALPNVQSESSTYNSKEGEARFVLNFSKKSYRLADLADRLNEAVKGAKAEVTDAGPGRIVIESSDT